MQDFNRFFAQQLRSLRRERGLTQRYLADQLGYSEKTVSKWETGGGLPDAECLCRLADLLKVDLNRLLRVPGEPLLLGIDGGGTKTRLALCELSGKVRATLQVGPCNPRDAGMEKAQETLREGIHAICGKLSLSSVYAYAGISGCRGLEAEFRKFFDEFGFAGYGIGSDNQNIIAAGLGDQEGIATILGTGFCVFQVYGGQQRQIAGWGYLLDEGGCGYNLGRDALSAYFSARDGSGPATALTEIVERRYGITGRQLLREIYDRGKSFIASFALDVFEADAAGDAVAAGILRRNLEVVRDKLVTAAQPFWQEHRSVKIVLAGGMTRSPGFLPKLQAVMPRELPFTLQILETDPVFGAVQLANKIYQEAVPYAKDRRTESENNTH